MPKSSFWKKKWSHVTNCWSDEGIHIFLKGISPKVKVMALLEFEFEIQQVSHYTKNSLHVTKVAIFNGLTRKAIICPVKQWL